MRGFTLVELVVTMAVMAVLAAGIAIFIAYPVQSYELTVRRAELVDSANAAYQRMSRELNTALPNSVRVSTVAGVTYLEFLQTRTGGRYRSEPASPAVPSDANTCPDTDVDTFADEDMLTFGVPDTCFRTIGLVDTSPLAANSTTPIPGDSLVIYNLGPGYIGANAYAAGPPSNRSLITGFAPSVNNENRITFAANTFPLDSPGRRFQVVSGPVTFACDPATGQLLRYGGYAITTAQPTPPAVAPAVLANRVTGCAITYNVVNTRTSVVDIALQLSDTAGGATPANVSLFNQVQLSNVP